MPDIAHLRHICGHIRDEDLIIEIAEGITLPDTDPVKYTLHGVWCYWEIDPFSDKLTLIVFIQIGNKCPYRKIVHRLLRSFLTFWLFSVETPS